MNILYISDLPAKCDIGPYWSVPNQVGAQAKYDNVFWYNLRDVEDTYWSQTAPYHSLHDYPSGKISDLPAPFNRPDLIVCEEIYKYRYFFMCQLWKLKIPYIVVPRGSLTNNAQKQSRLKKTIGNILLFKKFVSKACAIQYLTSDEKQNSSVLWNKCSIVIPNGVSLTSPLQGTIHVFNKDKINGVFIGRISIFHKGLDLLVKACSIIQKIMRDNNFTISVYGPDHEFQRDCFVSIIKKYAVSDIIKVYDYSLFGQQKEDTIVNSDIFFLTSRLEGHPMGLIEALSYGLPAVITEGVNMKDDFLKYDAGWVSKIDSNSIAEVLKSVIHDRNSWNVKSRNAICISKTYQWDKLALLAHKEYENLIGKF